MAERITPATKKILQKVYKERTRKVIEEGIQKGTLMQEQDGWHSEAGQRMEEQALLSSKMAVDTAAQLHSSEEMKGPEQNEVVEMGHRVRTNFLDDEEIIDYAEKHSIPPSELVTNVHLLSTIDRQYLTKILEGFDNITEMVVSDKSPVGKALLRARRNDIVTYGRNMKIRILGGPDAIETSSLLSMKIDESE